MKYKLKGSSFVIGAGSVLELFSHDGADRGSFVLNGHDLQHLDVDSALASDWRAMGGDFRKAIRKVDPHHGWSKRNE